MSKILRTIRKAIKTGDKSRYRLWKETGIDQSHLSKIINGDAQLSLDSLERLAEALDLEIVIRPKTRKRKA